jgi:hypothetical protein
MLVKLIDDMGHAQLVFNTLANIVETNYEICIRLTLISQLTYLTQVLLKDLNCTQLLLFVLDDGLWWNHLLGYTRRNEYKVFLGDLHAALLGVELADSHALAHLTQLKLLGFVSGELYHVQPGHSCAILSMALQNARRAIEQPLESLNQDGSQRSCAKIACHALVAVEHALVVAKQREYVGQSVIVGDQRQVLVELACEVVDLQVVVRLGGFGEWRRGKVDSVVRRASLSLEIAVRHGRMVLRGHVALAGRATVVG